MISIEAVKKAIGIFSLMKFFPGDEDSRAALMEFLGEICSDDEQVIWLARRVRDLHQEWPGAQEVRATLCSKYRPKDGIDAYSSVFLNGVPSEKPIPRLLMGEEPRRALPAGHVASVDPEAEQIIRDLADNSEPKR